jgi:hypothetical protein
MANATASLTATNCRGGYRRSFTRSRRAYPNSDLQISALGAGIAKEQPAGRIVVSEVIPAANIATTFG